MSINYMYLHKLTSVPHQVSNVIDREREGERESPGAGALAGQLDTDA